MTIEITQRKQCQCCPVCKDGANTRPLSATKFTCVKHGLFEVDASMEQQVANQEHYTQFEVQPMEYCQRNKLGWCASNVVKYVSRENKKDGIKDLYKAMDYLRCLIHWKETGIFLTPDKLVPVKK